MKEYGCNLTGADRRPEDHVRILFVHPHGSNWMGAGNDITAIFNLMPPLGMLSIAAFLEAGRVQSVGANTGINYELDAISACVIGGVSFSGGVGTIPGVVIGAIILQAINFSLVFLQVNAYYQYIIRGLIIIIAVAIDVRKYLAKK